MPSANPEGKTPRDQGLKVLIVDTDVKTVHELGAALRRRGWEPLEADSFEEGKRLWMAERPSMLIADVRLGQFNGLQLLLRARIDRPDVTAIITCPFPDAVLEAETVRFGGTFLVKPLAAEHVVTLLAASRGRGLVQAYAAPERRGADRRTKRIHGFTPERRMDERRRTGIGR